MSFLSFEVFKYFSPFGSFKIFFSIYSISLTSQVGLNMAQDRFHADCPSRTYWASFKRGKNIDENRFVFQLSFYDSHRGQMKALIKVALLRAQEDIFNIILHSELKFEAKVKVLLNGLFWYVLLQTRHTRPISSPMTKPPKRGPSISNTHR